MKRSILCTVLFLLFNTLYSQYNPTWHDMVDAPAAPDELLKHDDIFFLDDSTGWLVTRSGGIYKTVDGGLNWDLQLQDDAYFRCVGFIDSQKGFVGNLHGEEGNVLYKTLDGGETWEIIEDFDGPDPEGLCGLWVYDENTIYGVGRVFGPSYFVRSTDGGDTWESFDLDDISGMAIDLYFWTADSGIIIGGTERSSAQSRMLVLFTDDGGDSWESIYDTDRTHEWGWKIVFPRSDIGYISIQRASYSDPATEYFLKSSNGGLTWEDMPFWDYDSLSPSVYSANGIGFLTPLKGWMGSWLPYRPTLETNDGGLTWSEAGFGQNLNRFRFLSDTLGYASGRRAYKLIDSEFWDFPPIIELPNEILMNEDEPITVEFTGYDPDYQPFFYDYEINNTYVQGDLNVTTFGNMELDLTSDENWFGNAYVYITLNDGIYQVHDTSFVTVFQVNDPPGEFELVYPEYDEQNIPSNPIFMWSTSADVDMGDDVKYNLFISREFDFSNLEYSALELDETVHETIIELDNDTRYFWRVDAVDNDSAVTTSDLFSFVVGTLPTSTLFFSYYSDWNLVGAPFIIEDLHYLSLYPNAIHGTLYQFDGMYIEVNTLDYGEGYWLRFERDSVSYMEGTPFNEVSLSISEGWNLVTGPSYPSSIDDVIDPNGIIVPGTLFGWQLAYVQESVLQSGNGYWLRAYEDGEVTFVGNSRSTIEEVFLTQLENMNLLSFKNEEGASFDLFYGGQIAASEQLSYSMPPVPPLNGFDVRFKGDWRYSENGGEIFIQNDQWPLIIKNQLTSDLMQNHGWILTNPSTGKQFVLDGSQPIKIIQPITKLILSRGEYIPTSYALHQNYPNPFNPRTTIRFNLPEVSRVHLSIFNLLGQEVGVLVNGEMESGSHTVAWDGSNYSSGIYIFKLRTDFGHLTNKMVLLK